MTTPIPSYSTPGQFRTSDLYFAAFLKVAGISLIETVREEGTSRMFFVFTHSDSIRDLKHAYFGRQESKISPLSFVDEIRSLKSLIHF